MIRRPDPVFPMALLPPLLPLLLVFLTTGIRAAERPNILWIVSEDNSAAWLGAYGNDHTTTPNLDRLAAQGQRYTRCFADAPVCATQRSTWITGMLSLSLGTHPMRSDYPVPDTIPIYPRLLRDAGYHTRNGSKTDYNGIDGKRHWNANEGSLTPWRNAPENQPWFCVINVFDSHESRAFNGIDDTGHDPADMELAAYHPDDPTIRKNYALYADALKNMDAKVGRALDALKKDGLDENTIVVYNSDHGGVMPRSKRFLFESGIHCPLIVRVPDAFREFRPAAPAGGEVGEIVSFHDLIPTFLTMAGAKVPGLMHGRPFLGPDRGEPRSRHFAYRERMDERYDNARAVRDERYLYIRNYAPYAPWMQRLAYLWKMPAAGAWADHAGTRGATGATGRWFAPKNAAEELYDTREDPDCIDNLAADPAHAARLGKMRSALREWQLRVRDTALLPEAERLRRAKARDLTLYEMARDPELYDLPAYLDAADRATAGNPGNLAGFIEDLGHDDAGLRYWAAIGLLMLDPGERGEAGPALRRALEDDCHEVRAHAAWALIQQGGAAAEPARAALSELLETRSRASLIVLNVLDWMGRGALPLRDSITAYAAAGDIDPYDRRLCDHLSAKLRGLAGE